LYITVSNIQCCDARNHMLSCDNLRCCISIPDVTHAMTDLLIGLPLSETFVALLANDFKC
jgi:hypothetical protein